MYTPPLSVLLVLVLGAVGSSLAWLWHQAEAARGEAVTAQEHLTDEQKRTETALGLAQEAQEHAVTALRSERQTRAAEQAIEERAPSEELQTLEAKTDALQSREAELAARDEARRLAEAARRVKEDRKSDA